jgi:hypothetical protein
VCSSDLCLKQNLTGLSVGSWASNTISFFMADMAAREILEATHELRKHALSVMFGKSCPRTIRDRLVPMPLLPGCLFGPNFQSEITTLAKAQSSLGSLSAAVVQLGGVSLANKPGPPPKPSFKPPQAPRAATKPKNRANQAAWQSGWQTPQVPQPPKARKQRKPDYRASQPPQAPAVLLQVQQQQQLQLPQQQWAPQPEPSWDPARASLRITNWLNNIMPSLSIRPALS